jgi:competence protein ComEA
VFVLVGLGSAVLVSVLGGQGSTSEVISPTPGASSSGLPTESLLVHVLGAIARPGLYELRSGDRTLDAIAAAGGFTDDADRDHLNLAKPLTDGEQLRVPVIGEAPVIAAEASDGRVNLNSADAAALDTLPRVGPAMAERIIQWRDDNGGFTAVEDLLSVTGIGQKTFDSLKDLVTV